MTTSPQHRNDLGSWLNQAGLLGQGAEIGCAFGGFSSLILSQWKGERLYLVDPWERQSTDVYREDTSQVDYEAWFRDCAALAERDPRAVILRKYSVDAAKEFLDGQLDFVFIDANHSFGSVLEDMDAWYPKVKIGGLMAGHDFNDGTDFPHFCEVESAVTRWAKEREVNFTVSDCKSWWILKSRK